MTPIRMRESDMLRTTNRNAGNLGFTLVELLIAIAVGSIVMAAVMTSFFSQHNVYLAQDEVVQIQQNARVAMDMLTRDIHSAGYNPNHLAGGAGITNAGTTTLTFTRDNGTGLLETIAYNRSGANMLTLNITPLPTGTIAADWPANVAENIINLEFCYLLSSGNCILAPTAAQIPNIRSIQVSIMVETALMDTKSPPPVRTYTTPSGAVWPSTAGFRSRYLTTTVQCRNLGL